MMSGGRMTMRKIIRSEMEQLGIYTCFQITVVYDEWHLLVVIVKNRSSPEFFLILACLGAVDVLSPVNRALDIENTMATFLRFVHVIPIAPVTLSLTLLEAKSVVGLKGHLRWTQPLTYYHLRAKRNFVLMTCVRITGMHLFIGVATLSSYHVPNYVLGASYVSSNV
jgi:hypothetical protein